LRLLLSAWSNHVHAGGPDDWFGHKAVAPSAAGAPYRYRRKAITSLRRRSVNPELFGG
jgi:hypothetical protein